jgi:ribosomal protein S12 methylthiotransferase accessory factor
MPAELLVLGEGALHDAFRGRVAAGAASLDAAELVVALHDAWRPRELAAIQRACRSAGKRLLPCRLDGAQAIIGPVIEPARGCAVCAESRRRPIASLPPAPLRPVAPAWAPPALAAAADVAADVADRALDRAELHDRAFVLQGDSSTGQWHPVRPLAGCPECAAPPDDAPAALPGGATPQEDPESFRQHRSPPARAGLREALLDWRYGPIAHVFRVQNAPMPVTGAEFPARADGKRESGWGRATTYARAESVAFHEALERWATMRPRGKRTVVRAAYRQVAGDAIDPRTLGLPDPGLVGEPGSALVPWSDALEVPWVWGWSFARRRPVLVPEQCVYYGTPGGRRFNYESSNGAASGASLAEAILYGLFEVIERDAFLITWYGRLPVPELPVEELAHRESLMLVDKLEAAGYRARLFDTTLDLRVPSIWALAVHRGTGAPRSFTAAGAHPDPQRAALSALRELVPDVFMYRAEHTDDQLRAMLRDPRKVRGLEDHVALYTLPEAAERLSFLDASPRRSFGEAFADWRRWVRPTIEEALGALCDHVLEHCGDVIAVDLTTPGGRAIGQHTAKVLVPGTLPMTFGEHHRRTHGLPRLVEVPARLGYWPAPRTVDQLHLYPHPFP